jgi:hypothetical protein
LDAGTQAKSKKLPLPDLTEQGPEVVVMSGIPAFVI